MQPRTVADIMRKVVFVVRPEDDLDMIAEGLHYYGLRSLPVVDGLRRLVGMLDERAVLPRSPVTRQGRAEVLVRDIMYRNVTTLSEHAPILSAARLLAESPLDSVPVVSTAGQLVGIVTAQEVARLAATLLAPYGRAPALQLAA